MKNSDGNIVPRTTSVGDITQLYMLCGLTGNDISRTDTPLSRDWLGQNKTKYCYLQAGMGWTGHNGRLDNTVKQHCKVVQYGQRQQL